MLILRGVQRVPVPDRAGAHRRSPRSLRSTRSSSPREARSTIVELRVETNPEFPFDEIAQARNASRSVWRAELKGNLQIAVDIKLVEPKSIERSEGKAKRIIDLRKGSRL